MRIVIDRGFDNRGNVAWEQVIHTEVAPWNTLPDPNNPVIQIDMVTFLTRLSGNAALQTSAGWHVMNQLAGEAVPTHRWQRLLNAVALLPTGDPLRLLNLLP